LLERSVSDAVFRSRDEEEELEVTPRLEVSKEAEDIAGCLPRAVD
jgi:hypothetical protein